MYSAGILTVLQEQYSVSFIYIQLSVFFVINILIERKGHKGQRSSPYSCSNENKAAGVNTALMNHKI